MNEEQRRVEEAKNCDGCPGWTKYCKAECCTEAYINLDPKKLKAPGEFLIVHKKLSKDMIWYYKLRGVRYFNGKLHFDKKHLEKSGDKIIYKRKCDLLTDDYNCSGHPNNKPSICKLLKVNTTGAQGIVVTKNCLFKYKNMESGGNE